MLLRLKVVYFFPYNDELQNYLRLVEARRPFHRKKHIAEADQLETAFFWESCGIIDCFLQSAVDLREEIRHEEHGVVGKQCCQFHKGRLLHLDLVLNVLEQQFVWVGRAVPLRRDMANLM